MLLGRNRRVRWVAGLVALVLSATLAACGGSDSEPSTAGTTAGEPVPVKVGFPPGVQFAPLFVGINQGFFEEHGIDLQPDMGGLAPTIYPRILEGQLELGANTWGTLITAAAQGLPLTGIAPIDRGGDTVENDYQLIVGAPNGVTELEELEGKTVAVPSLGGYSEAGIRSVLSEAGIDPTQVEFTAMPFPDMVSALKSGRVDAATLLDPLLGQVLVDGGAPLASLSQGQLVGAIVASEEWVRDNPETVEGFDAAWAETLDYVKQHPEAVRKALVDDFGFPEAAAENARLPQWASTSDPAEVQRIADMMYEAELLPEPVDAETIITPYPFEAQ